MTDSKPLFTLKEMIWLEKDSRISCNIAGLLTFSIDKNPQDDGYQLVVKKLNSDPVSYSGYQSVADAKTDANQRYRAFARYFLTPVPANHPVFRDI